MSDERKGFLLPEQEKILDDLYKGKGIDEAVDGLLIKLGDNMGLEKLKAKLRPEDLPIVYGIIDEIFDTVLKPLTEQEN